MKPTKLGFHRETLGFHQQKFWSWPEKTGWNYLTLWWKEGFNMIQPTKVGVNQEIDSIMTKYRSWGFYHILPPKIGSLRLDLSQKTWGVDQETWGAKLSELGLHRGWANRNTRCLTPQKQGSCSNGGLEQLTWGLQENRRIDVSSSSCAAEINHSRLGGSPPRLAQIAVLFLRSASQFFESQDM